MSKMIEKKVWPESFAKILSGEKTYDIRLADWDCAPGDTFELKEFDPVTKKYTGRSIKKRVGYVGKTKGWEPWPKKDIDKYGYQIISLLPEDAR